MKLLTILKDYILVQARQYTRSDESAHVLTWEILKKKFFLKGPYTATSIAESWPQYLRSVVRASRP